MATVKVQIKSNHEDGDSIENTITLNLDDALLGEMATASDVDWAQINASILSYPDYISIVKEQMQAHKIEVPDANYWTTNGTVIGINDQNMPEDYDVYMIEERLMTGDFLD